MSEFKKSTPVLNRDKTQTGVLTGGTRHCRMSGCRGLGMGVRWQDGKLTWPCSKGMTFNETTQTWEIQ